MRCMALGEGWGGAWAGAGTCAAASSTGAHLFDAECNSAYACVSGGLSMCGRERDETW